MQHLKLHLYPVGRIFMPIVEIETFLMNSSNAPNSSSNVPCGSFLFKNKTGYFLSVRRACYGEKYVNYLCSKRCGPAIEKLTFIFVGFRSVKSPRKQQFEIARIKTIFSIYIYIKYILCTFFILHFYLFYMKLIVYIFIDIYFSCDLKRLNRNLC